MHLYSKLNSRVNGLCKIIKGSRKKKFIFSGPATKRGEGVKAAGHFKEKRRTKFREKKMWPLSLGGEG